MGLKSSAEPVNPFPGLRPFRPDENKMFFGRESEVGEISGKLLQNRIISVIGAAGCGKSSLINCGLIPEMISLTGKEKSSLKIISFSPGNDPIGNMKNALAEAICEKVLIIVDQFEELFTHNRDETGILKGENTSEFVVLLRNAVNQTSAEIYIVLAIRSENIGECAQIEGLTKLINNSNYLVPQMAHGNYKSIFENSFLSAGARINPRLVVTVLDDISDLNDPLAILQHMMMRIYSCWSNTGDTGRAVDLSDYLEAGTINGALSKHAEEAFEELDPELKVICRSMFRAMCGERIDRKETRHPLTVASLKSILQCTGDEVSQIIEKFRAPSRSFLTPVFTVPLDEKSVIDFSTERLTGMWNRLKYWHEEELSSVMMYRQLSETSEMFQKGKATLLKDTDLHLAVKWRDSQKPTLSWAARYDPAFERVMVYIRTSEKAYYEKEQSKIGEQRRKFRSRRITSLILRTIVIISIGLMLFSFEQKLVSDRKKSEAERQHALALANVRIAEEKTFMDGEKLAKADSVAAVAAWKEQEARQLNVVYNNQLSNAERKAAETGKQLTLAIEQSDSARRDALTAEMKAANAIKEKNEAHRKRMIAMGKSMSLKSLQLPGQKDLQSLLACQAYKFNKSNGGLPNDADIYSGLYNVAKLYGSNYYKTFSGHEGEIKNIAFVPGKNEFFTSGSDGKVMKWDINGKNQSLQVFYSGTEIINVLAVSPDATWLACGEENSGIRMVPVQGNDLSYELRGHSGPVKSLIFSYDGKYLYSSSLDGKVLKWDISSRTSTNVSGGMLQISSIDLSSDNRYIAGVSNDGKVAVWNPDVTSDNFRIESTGKVIRSIKFKPDENILAVGYSDGFVDFWDISARKKISELKAHSSEVTNIRFNKKLSQMATSGNDKSVRLWDMTELTGLPVSFNDSEGLIFCIEFSSDGQVIVTGTSEGKNNLIGRPVLADLLNKDVSSSITRNFTPEEWQAYVSKDIEYEKTVADSAFKIRVNVIK